MVYKYEEDFFNIFDFLMLLYRKKLTLISFLIIGILFGYILKTQEAVKLSEINIQLNNKPQSYEQEQLYKSFTKFFYKKEIFDSWKNNRETLINFDDIKKNYLVNNVLTTRPLTDRKVHFENEAGKLTAKLKLQSIEEANEIFNYFKFLNQIVSKEYYNLLIEEKSLLENIIFGQVGVSTKTNFKEKIPLQILDETLYNFLGMNRFISQYNNKEFVFEISRPSQLYSSSKLPFFHYLIIILFLIAGIIFIIFIEGFKNHLKKIDNNLDK